MTINRLKCIIRFCNVLFNLKQRIAIFIWTITCEYICAHVQFKAAMQKCVKTDAAEWKNKQEQARINLGEIRFLLGFEMYQIFFCRIDIRYIYTTK